MRRESHLQFCLSQVHPQTTSFEVTRRVHGTMQDTHLGRDDMLLFPYMYNQDTIPSGFLRSRIFGDHRYGHSRKHRENQCFVNERISEHSNSMIADRCFWRRFDEDDILWLNDGIVCAALYLERGRRFGVSDVTLVLLDPGTLYALATG
ncbi:hypothetical protein CERZMDRAFT_83639 [Cercospora zeae-maydis SCOH1-5]|uniref:Uncharacterized protein n=1 Tax=Cercospora zeae-maydis SCOH1-5 TaxID=717836 RepID=A0A6A6FJ69_9PEZI|nr:hypothetical protein CERZMDRAFT_83639 [Cercospora zeae-maydis SCOH1-5]